MTESIDTMATFPRKHLFEMPNDVIYLDGNSLGPLPKNVLSRVNEVITKEWGERLIRGWNDSKWMEQPLRVGNQIGKLIGALENTVIMGDTLSIKVYQALSAALELNPQRRVILSDSGNFPTDLYMAQGLIQSLNNGYELHIVEPEDVITAIDETVAAVMITHVDYRTGRMHNMQRITQKAHKNGAVMIWDLAHSAGAVPVDLSASNCDMAVGCTYKYLNGGPGSPAFIYVRPDIIEKLRPTLSGWMGHDSPFAFTQAYQPAKSIERLRVGTPPVIQLSILEEALKIWQDVDMNQIRDASIVLSETLIREVEKRCPQLKLVSPRDPLQRGSQVSFAFEHGYAAMQSIIAQGVIGDFRAPDIMRFGLTPLYLDEQDVISAVDVLETVLNQRLWDKLDFQKTRRVT
ncbi:MAG: kynureninase [Urechidicola sp.]|jgi:kynureninase